MIKRLASKMRDEFSSIIRAFTSATVSEANEASLAIINSLIAETSRTEAEIARLRAENERLRAALEDILSYVPHGDLPLNLYDKARAALDGQPAPSPWGPIETAPKTQDESRFGPLIVLTSTHGHRAIGYWGERGGRWGWVNPNDHQIMDYWNAFTHWMPLPPAPKEVEG